MSSNQLQFLMYIAYPIINMDARPVFMSIQS